MRKENITKSAKRGKAPTTIPADYLERAEVAINLIRELYPTLGAFGWITSHWQADRTDPEPHPFNVEQVATSMMFVEEGPVKWTRAARWSSYEAKHVAEDWGKALGFSGYISNGNFIAGCLGVGISTRHPAGSTNSKVSLKFIVELQKSSRDELTFPLQSRAAQS
jgi:hypothetical protein